MGREKKGGRCYLLGSKLQTQRGEKRVVAKIESRLLQQFHVVLADVLIQACVLVV